MMASFSWTRRRRALGALARTGPRFDRVVATRSRYAPLHPSVDDEVVILERTAGDGS
jgi:hypothetical protein